jgi:hypothetical protein
MLKSSLGVLFSLLLLMVAPFQMGLSLAQETTSGYTVQNLTTITDPEMYLGYLQAIGNWKFQNFEESGAITLNFSNAMLAGITSISAGLGSVRNQGSVAFLNLKPSEVVLPQRQLGLLISENNQVTMGDYAYSANINFSNFSGAGVLVANVTASSFSNLFTAVTVSMGRIPITPVSIPSLTVIPENPGSFTTSSDVIPGTSVVALSNEQMDIIAGTANNEFIYEGKQQAAATVSGAANFSGIYAVTVSAGVDNKINNTVQANFNTTP